MWAGNLQNDPVNAVFTHLLPLCSAIFYNKTILVALKKGFLPQNVFKVTVYVDSVFTACNQTGTPYRRKA